MPHWCLLPLTAWQTEDDVRELQQRLRGAERDVERLTNQIAEAQKKAGDDKLAMYRHHSALVSKKLQQKEADLEEAERELADVNREIEDKEAKISEMAGPKFMGREEFKRYDSQLREKVNKYRKLKAELNEIEHETVILTRTVAVSDGCMVLVVGLLAALARTVAPPVIPPSSSPVGCRCPLCCLSRSCKARTRRWASSWRSWRARRASAGTQRRRRSWRR